MKPKETLEERLKQLMCGYEMPHGSEFKDLLAFVKQELKRRDEELIKKIMFWWEQAIFYSEEGKGMLNEEVMENHYKSALKTLGEEKK